MPNQKPMIPVEMTSQIRFRSSPSVSMTSSNPTLGAQALHEADAGLLGGGKDLSDAEQADRHRHEADPGQDPDLAEREPRLSGDPVEADRGQEQAEADHHHGLHR